MLLPEHAAKHNKRRELSNLQDLPPAIDRPRVRGLTECDRAILDAVLGDIAPAPDSPPVPIPEMRQCPVCGVGVYTKNKRGSWVLRKDGKS